MPAGYQHWFKWEGQASQVIVTGTFDNWSSSLLLTKQRHSSTFTAPRSLPFGVKIVYKYVVDGVWQHSPHEPMEWDSAGNVNNVFTPPELAIPRIPTSEPLLFTTRDRNFQISRWDGGRLEVLAGIHLSPSSPFSYASLRAVLDLFLEIKEGFRFGRLCNPSPESSVSSAGTSGGREGSSAKPSYYEVEMVDEGEGEEVERGFFVLLQPAKSHPISLLPSSPLSPHLRPSKAALSAPSSHSEPESEASFSTALSTSFSVSVLGSANDDYVCVHDASTLWHVEKSAASVGIEEDDVRELWMGLAWGFDPYSDFRPISFTASCDAFLPYITYTPPSTSLEKQQGEEYLEGHFLECVLARVRGAGNGEVGVGRHGESDFGDEWEDALVLA